MASTTTIHPKTALYIKLGEGGGWERECIQKDQTLRLGYQEVDHWLCCQGRWEEVATELLSSKTPKYRGAVTRHANQVRLFYESGEDVLWVTFFGDRLWWCFSRPEVTLLPDKSKTRPVIGSWNCCDAKDEPLEVSRLSGKLVTMQRFQGTICAVKEFDYVLRKINAVPEPLVEAAKLARGELVGRIATIIRNLHWRDFEILVDLIFHQAGWQRISELGGTQKTFDLKLVSPITGERYAVQVKSEADLATFASYEHRFSDMEAFARAYFVVHSPSKDLLEHPRTGKVELLGPDQIAERSVRYGLVDWIIDKAG
jgi:hypothetical protein